MLPPTGSQAVFPPKLSFAFEPGGKPTKTTFTEVATTAATAVDDSGDVSLVLSGRTRARV